MVKQEVVTADGIEERREDKPPRRVGSDSRYWMAGAIAARD
jgi:hypothetical protein